MLKCYFLITLISIIHSSPTQLMAQGESEIVNLLDECQIHMDANRLTTGIEGTAFPCYKKVLELDPYNVVAKEGLQKIEKRYKVWAESALRDGRLYKAEVYLSRLEEVNPFSEVLVVLKRQLRELDTREAIRREVESYITDQANEIKPKDIAIKIQSIIDKKTINHKEMTGSQPQQAKAKKEFEETQIQEEIEICASLLKIGRLTTIEVEEGEETALRCYKKVLGQYPNNEDAKEGLRKVENYYVEHAKKSDNKVNIRRYIEGLKLSNPESTTLSMIQKHLVDVLLKNCRSYLKNNWLTTDAKDDPSENTALSCYQEVLSLESNNTEALEGLRNIEAKYIGLTTKAADNGDIEKLELYISRLESVNSESPSLLELRKRLKELPTITAEAKASAEIIQQLNRCDNLFQRGLLTKIEIETEKGEQEESALRCYERILNQFPSDKKIIKKASEGQKNIEMHYLKVAKTAKKSKKLEQSIKGLSIVKPNSTDLLELQKRYIELLLHDCRNYLQNKWLTTDAKDEPTETTALSCYQKVLGLDSDNTEALQGLKEIENNYVLLSTNAANNDDIEKLELYIKRLEFVNPESKSLLELRKRLDNLPELKREAEKAAKLARQLQRCDSLFRRGRLTKLEGESDRGTAFVCYEQILKNNPDNKGAADGLKKIEAQYLEAAQKAKKSIDLERNIEGLKIVSASSNFPELNSSLIELLLKECRSYVNNKWLTTDANNVQSNRTAIYCYKKVLTLEPDNTEASKGLKDIEVSYVELATEAAKNADIEKLKLYIKRLESVNSESPGLLDLRKHLSKMRSSEGEFTTF